MENILFAGVCPSFSPEILQAGAVTGLMAADKSKQRLWLVLMVEADRLSAEIRKQAPYLNTVQAHGTTQSEEWVDGKQKSFLLKKNEKKSSHFVSSQGLMNCNLEYRQVLSQEQVNCSLFRVQACLVTTYTTSVDGQNAL